MISSGTATDPRAAAEPQALAAPAGDRAREVRSAFAWPGWRRRPRCGFPESRARIRDPRGCASPRRGTERVEGVNCVAAGGGGYEVSLCLVCRLVPLHRLGEPGQRRGAPRGVRAPVSRWRPSMFMSSTSRWSDAAAGHARLIGSLLMVLLALVGLGVAAYCLDGFISLGSLRPDRLLGLPVRPAARRPFPEPDRRPGNTAALALVCGVGRDADRPAAAPRAR